MLLSRLALALVALLAAVTPAPPWSGLPMRTTTRSGIAGDPINIAFEGSRAQILAAFAGIGWVQADTLSAHNDSRLALDAVMHRPYPKAPVSRLYLFGRQEDFAMEHELGSVARRDHARFWDTGRMDPATHLDLWIGDASRDAGIEVLRRHHIPIGTTHHIDPNLDAERASIVQALQAEGLVVTVVMEPGIGPTTNGKNGGGDRFYTDGKVALVVL
jgi:hypothetical protein